MGDIKPGGGPRAAAEARDEEPVGLLWWCRVSTALMLPEESPASPGMELVPPDVREEDDGGIPR